MGYGSGLSIGDLTYYRTKEFFGIERTRSIPTSFKRKVTEICGKTPAGGPYLRVVWMPDQEMFACGDPHVPKYGEELKYFMLENWLPPEFFGTPEQWSESRWHQEEDGSWLDVLGEYPRRGLYGAFLPLMDSNGLPIYELDNRILDAIRAITYDNNNKTHAETAGIRWRNYLERQAREALAKQKRIDDACAESLEYINTNAEKLLAAASREKHKDLGTGLREHYLYGANGQPITSK